MDTMVYYGILWDRLLTLLCRQARGSDPGGRQKPPGIISHRNQQGKTGNYAIRILDRSPTFVSVSFCSASLRSFVYPLSSGCVEVAGCDNYVPVTNGHRGWAPRSHVPWTCPSEGAPWPRAFTKDRIAGRQVDLKDINKQVRSK